MKQIFNSKYLKDSIHETIRDLTSFGSPIVLVIIIFLFFGFTLESLLLLAGFVVIEVICSLLKYFLYKDRPIKKDHQNILEKVDAGSFPSIHSARSSYIFTTIFFLSPYSFVKILAIIIPFMVCSTRVLLKKHYLIDVVAGYLIGVLFAWIWTFVFKAFL